MHQNSTAVFPDPARPSHRHHHNPPGAHLKDLLDESISGLAPFSALILSLCVICVFIIRLYFFEGFLVRTKLYRARYDILSEEQRRSFINHHVAAITKLVLLITAAYPFMSIAFGTATPQTSFVAGSRISLGDILIVCSNIFTVMYVFELFYRVNVSPISALHHIGAIVIAQTAIAVSLDFLHRGDAVLEFIICYVWGAFDCSAELWPHLAIIVYRLVPLSSNTPASQLSTAKAAGNHLLMSRIFRFTCFLETLGTAFETLVIFWLYGMVWMRWTLPFKIMTPILHILFSCAQLWSAWNFRQLSRREGERGRALLHRAQEEIQIEHVPAVADTRSEKAKERTELDEEDEDEEEEGDSSDDSDEDTAASSSSSGRRSAYKSEGRHARTPLVTIEEADHET